MSLSAADLVSEIDSATEKSLAAKSYAIGSRRVERNSIADLMKARAMLLLEAERQSGASPIFSVVQVDPVGGAVDGCGRCCW